VLLNRPICALGEFQASLSVERNRLGLAHGMLSPSSVAPDAVLTLVSVARLRMLSLAPVTGGVLLGAALVGCTAWVRRWRSSVDAVSPRRREQHSRREAQLGFLTDTYASSPTASLACLGESKADMPAGLAFVLIGCDRFQLINAAYGSITGGRVLAAVAERIGEMFPLRHALVRAGGDTFLLVVDFLDGPAAALAIARQLDDAFKRPLSADQQSVYLGVSVGIALAPQDGRRADVLLVAAESALHEAKRDGRGCARLYDVRLGQGDAERARNLQRLHSALAMSELLLHYQPKVRLSDGVCVGFEALLRRSSGNGVQGPCELIIAAEQSGLIGRLGEWVILEAAAQARAWRGEGLLLPIAVNISILHLQQPEFIEFIRGQCKRMPELPTLLQMELTESALVSDEQQVVQTLAALGKLGFQLQLDDFGTGYSNLALLTSMPIHGLKIDRTFLVGLPTAEPNQHLVRAMLRLARELALVVVAEGIETAEQVSWLQEEGCELGQGFFYAHALPASAAAAFARERNAEY
jgi:diguanylate cyclase (GGDEF)-like protein